ncbi:hypothetical protein C9374_009037 [Naegleria lovaniensis]|uniref:F-box domain-containing protein n=1 Tax=Naegleria lovaniensis TaxID=51637 RepID=A0AA88GHZ5_NAELO|nr:uncharacterized protein C9374_009037 [Naegleria lovaniensis]KAG2377521.1 hypothetical protein C9374_009037 [Naegleria lovaniensis]
MNENKKRKLESQDERSQIPKHQHEPIDHDHHYGIFINNCLLSMDVVETHILSYLKDVDLLQVACTCQCWRFAVGLQAPKRDLFLFDEILSENEMKYGLSLLWKSITLIACRYEKLLSTFHCGITSLTIIGGQTNRSFVQQLCTGKFEALQQLALIICGYSSQQVEWLCEMNECFPKLKYFDFTEQRPIVSTDPKLFRLLNKLSHVEHFNMNHKYKSVHKYTDAIERRNTQLTYLAKNLSKGTGHDLRTVALIFYDGADYLKKDYEKAFKYYSMAANSGDHKSLEYVGYMYETGKGVQKDNTRAFECYSSGAKTLNRPNLHLRVAKMYEHGVGTPRDLKKAVEHYELCSHTCSDAAEFIGRVYEFGLEEIGISIDETVALEFYKRASSFNAEIQFKIGHMYEMGKGTPMNLFSAAYYYQKSANLGNIEADYALGRLALHHGQTPAQTGLEHLKKAALNNHVMALYELGTVYEQGLLDVKAADPEQALQYFEMAASKENVLAQCKLGFIYDMGTCGVEKSAEKAIQWYSKAAHHGDMKNLGLVYLYGRGVPVDLERAMNYLKLSAEKGNADAAFTMGTLYVKGNSNVENNPQKALQHFTHAISLNPNHTVSMYEIGKLYERRLLVTEEQPESTLDFTALDWYLRACSSSNDEFLEACYKVVKIAGRLKYLQDAYSKLNELMKKRGDQSSSSSPLALYLLGKIHEKGHLVGVDHSQAFNYYEKAAKLGFEMARKRLENMELVM